MVRRSYKFTDKKHTKQGLLSVACGGTALILTAASLSLAYQRSGQAGSIALSSSSESNPLADLALRQLPNLRGSQVHTSRMLSAADEKTFQKLGVMLTSEAK